MHPDRARAVDRRNLPVRRARRTASPSTRRGSASAAAGDRRASAAVAASKPASANRRRYQRAARRTPTHTGRAAWPAAAPRAARGRASRSSGSSTGCRLPTLLQIGRITLLPAPMSSIVALGMSPYRACAPLTGDWKHFDFTVDGDGVATITFNRPDKLNALTFEAYADLRDLLAELPQRGDAKVLVITGQGRGFCSGGDVEEIIGRLQELRDSRAARVHAHDRRGRQGAARVPAAGDRGGQRRGRRRRLGDRARVRLPDASPSRPRSRSCSRASGWLGRGHGLRLPAAADRRARPGDRAADAGRQGRRAAARTRSDSRPRSSSDERPQRPRGRARPAPRRPDPRSPTPRPRRCSPASSTWRSASAIELEAITQALLMHSDDFAEFYDAWSEGRKPDWTGR